jgi:hypothetical protein
MSPVDPDGRSQPMGSASWSDERKVGLYLMSWIPAAPAPLIWPEPTEPVVM